MPAFLPSVRLPSLPAMLVARRPLNKGKGHMRPSSAAGLNRLSACRASLRLVATAVLRPCVRHELVCRRPRPVRPAATAVILAAAVVFAASLAVRRRAVPRPDAPAVLKP